ncbi:hypothetical protein HDZ31DRAFT_84213 [Schizophyllum fasciatum]
MRNFVSLFAFVAAVTALTINVPEDPKSSGEVTITWDADGNDPDTFSMYLTNEAFHNTFAIRNNVDPSWGEVTLQLPVVPVGDGYTIIATNIGNINDVYATSAGFSVGEAASTSASSSQASTTSGVSSGASTGITVTSFPSSTSSFGHTASSSGSQSGSSSGTRSATSSGESASSTQFNGDDNAAAGLRTPATGIVAAVFAAVAALPFL